MNRGLNIQRSGHPLGDFPGQIVVWVRSHGVQEQIGNGGNRNLTASSSPLMKTFEIRETSEAGLMKNATENTLHRLPKARFWRGGERKWKGCVPPTDTETDTRLTKFTQLPLLVCCLLLEPERDESLWGSQWGGWWLFIFQMFSHVC